MTTAWADTIADWADASRSWIGGNLGIEAQQVFALVLTTVPELPAAALSQLSAEVLTTTPELPVAEVLTDAVYPDALEITPEFPQAEVATPSGIGHVVLEATPDLPAATLDAVEALHAIVLEAIPVLPAASFTRDHIVVPGTFSVTPVLPPALELVYSDQPLIVSIEPLPGTQGHQSVILGYRFTGATDLMLGGVSVAFTIESDVVIRFTVPLTVHGTVGVRVIGVHPSRITLYPIERLHQPSGFDDRRRPPPVRQTLTR